MKIRKNGQWQPHAHRVKSVYDNNNDTAWVDKPSYIRKNGAWVHDAETEIYGFRIDPTIDDSDNAVTYLEDAVGFTPAAMGANSFDYGSWANAFFMPKPCMVGFDGEVKYYLNPNDYSKKIDGTASDYNDLSYQGNVMIEFPLIWYKFVQGEAEGEGYFYCSNRKVDSDYKCWSNINSQNEIVDNFYMAAYNGCIYDEKMRSISGLKLSPYSTTAYSASSTYAVGAKVSYQGKMYECVIAVETAEAFDPEKWQQFAFNGSTIAHECINACTSLNGENGVAWYIDTWADRVLIQALLVLMSKSLDCQGKFGRGIDSGSQSAAENYVTGAGDDKGLFYGSTANGSTVVKVFGMENFWACKWHWTAGLLGRSAGGYLYKMTYNNADGSGATSYNTNGNQYLIADVTRPSSNYVQHMSYGLWGMVPKSTGAYYTKYWNDYFYTGTGFALVGGASYSGALCGFYVYLYNSAPFRIWNIAGSPSFKPLV